MTRREMTYQSSLALLLVIGIVGGNFVLHRWVLRDVTSREADAGTVSKQPLAAEDIPEWIPRRTRSSQEDSLRNPAHREQLTKLIQKHLPNATADEVATWIEELHDMPLSTAEDILAVRGQVGPLENVQPMPTKPAQLISTEPPTR